MDFSSSFNHTSVENGECMSRAVGFPNSFVRRRASSSVASPRCHPGALCSLDGHGYLLRRLSVVVDPCSKPLTTTCLIKLPSLQPNVPVIALNSSLDTFSAEIRHVVTETLPLLLVRRILLRCFKSHSRSSIFFHSRHVILMKP